MSNEAIPALKVGGVFRFAETLNPHNDVCAPFTPEVMLYELKKAGLDARIASDTTHHTIAYDCHLKPYSELTLDMTLVGIGDYSVSEKLFFGFLKSLNITPHAVYTSETTVPGQAYEDEFPD